MILILSVRRFLERVVPKICIFSTKRQGLMTHLSLERYKGGVLRLRRGGRGQRGRCAKNIEMI